MIKHVLFLGSALTLALGQANAHAQNVTPDREQVRDRTTAHDPTQARDKTRQQDKAQTPDRSTDRTQLQQKDTTKATQRDQLQAQDKTRAQDRDRLVDQAQTLTQDQTRQRDQLRDQIHKQANLNAQEQQALAQPLDHYVANGGDAQQLRATVNAALDTGCKGTCLAETVRSLNRAQHQGLSTSDAQATVTSALREMKQDRDRLHQSASDEQVRDQLRMRVGDRLQQRAADRAAERRMDRMQERHPSGPQDRGRGHGPGPHGPGGR